jgi:predicted transcriptional regulator
MKVSELTDTMNLLVVAGNKGLDKHISGAYVSDLLSDVMGNALEGQVWVTLQLHPNTVAIAALKDLAAIIVVKGLKPQQDTLVAANNENIPILSTEENCFEICGKLYNLLKGNAIV